MKIYKGRKKLAVKLEPLFFGFTEEEKKTIFNIKVGDLISGFHGFNVVVQKIEYDYVWSKNHKTWVLSGVILIDKDGYLTYTPDILNSSPKTKKEIEEYVLSWNTPKGIDILKEWQFTIIEDSLNKLLLGEEICDERGIRI